MTTFNIGERERERTIAGWTSQIVSRGFSGMLGSLYTIFKIVEVVYVNDIRRDYIQVS